MPHLKCLFPSAPLVLLLSNPIFSLPESPLEVDLAPKGMYSIIHSCPWSVRSSTQARRRGRMVFLYVSASSQRRMYKCEYAPLYQLMGLASRDRKYSSPVGKQTTCRPRRAMHELQLGEKFDPRKPQGHQWYGFCHHDNIFRL